MVREMACKDKARLKLLQRNNGVYPRNNKVLFMFLNPRSKKKPGSCLPGYKFLVDSYCNLKVIGILKGTLTARPLCLPGVIFGSFSIILKASASRFLSGPL